MIVGPRRNADLLAEPITFSRALLTLIDFFGTERGRGPAC